MNTIIQNKYHYHQNTIIIFVDFVCSNFMFFITLNSFHFVSCSFFVEQNVFEFTKICCNICSFCCAKFFIIVQNITMDFLFYSNQCTDWFSFMYIFYFGSKFFVSFVKKFWLMFTRSKQVFKKLCLKNSSLTSDFIL